MPRRKTRQARTKQRAVRIPESTPRPSSAEDLARAIFRQANRKERKPGFPILGVFRLKGQSNRDSGIIFRSCKASQSPVYPIRDAILAVNHATCPSLSSSAPANGMKAH